MPKFLVLHVSDVHFGCPDRLRHQGGITEGVVRAVKGHVARTGRSPDVCVFSGDLAHSGKPAQFESGENWLMRIREASGMPPVFVVPGNHDSARPRAGEKLAQAESLRSVVHDVKQFPRLRKEFRRAIGMHSFFNWHRKASDRLGLVSDWRGDRHACHAVIGSGDMKLELIGLNSAIASFDDKDQGKLFVDMESYSECIRKANADNNLVIAVAHHPVFNGPSMSSKWLTKWCGSDLKERLSQVRGPHLFLHGHLHDSRTYSFNLNTGAGILVCSAGAAYQGVAWPQKFAFIEVDTDEHAVTPVVYAWSRASGEWDVVSSESRPAAARLPKKPAPESEPLGVSRPVGPPRPTSPAASHSMNLDRLDHVSLVEAGRYVRSNLIHEPESLSRLKNMFSAALERDFDQTLRSFSKATPGNRYKLVGAPGCGKAELLALTFWTANTKVEGFQRFRPIFIDLEHWHHDLGLSSASELRDVIRTLGQRLQLDVGRRTPLILIRQADEQGWDDQSLFNGLCEEIEGTWGGVVLRTQFNAPESRVDVATRTVSLQPLPLNLQSCRLLVDGANSLRQDPLHDDELLRAAKSLEALSFAHRVTPNLFMAQLVLESDRSHGVVSLSGLLGRRLNRILVDLEQSAVGKHVSSESRGRPVDMLATLAEAAFRAYVANSSSERPATFIAEPSLPLRRLLVSNVMFDHWLVARHLLTRLAELGRLLGQAELHPGANCEEVTKICNELDCVYPTHIAAFAKEMFQQQQSDGPNGRLHAISLILSSRHLPVAYLLKATACYFAGRVTKRGAVADAVESLRRVVDETADRLGEVRAVRKALGILVDEVAFDAAAALLDHAQRLQSIRSPAASLENFDDLLATAEREVLLLQRSAYISICYNKENSFATECSEKYLLGLLGDSERDDLNRGFHLEYYGDSIYRPDSPLLSSDRSLEPFPKTQAWLVRNITSRSFHAGGLGIQAVTLASFARHRHAEGKLDKAARTEIAQCLAGAKQLIIQNERIQQFIATVIAELAYDDCIIERYIDALYELKFQRRTGWQGVTHDESVGAHSYFVELLARLLVPAQGTADLPSCEQVLDLVAFHDIGEAITGDIPYLEKTDKTREEEAQVVWRIAQCGALTHSDTFLRIADSFDKFERNPVAVDARIARDLDRLDLLIQLMRFRRENGTVGRYGELRGHVEPTSFESGLVRPWAERLLKYFDSVSSQAQRPSSTSLWPIPISSVRIRCVS